MARHPSGIVDAAADLVEDRPLLAIARAFRQDDDAYFHGELENEIGRMGFRRVLVRDGDPLGLQADVLLLIGNCRKYPTYTGMLARIGTRRPHTVLWQFDPLLPPDLSTDEYEETVSWLKIFFPVDGPPNRWRIPWGLRIVERSASALSRTLCRQLGKPALTELARRIATRWPGVTYKKIRLCAEAEHFIRQGWRQKWLHEIHVSTIQKRVYLARQGIPSTFAPTGYHDKLGEIRHERRDIDVLFIGTVRPDSRRHLLLVHLAEQLSHLNINLQIVTDCFGERRMELLNRTKVLLHLHNYSWDTPWMRFFLASANGAMVISEPMIEPRPFTPGKHFVQADESRLKDAIVTFVRSDEMRNEIVTSARRLVTTQFTLRNSLERMLESVSNQFGMGRSAQTA